jgi:hypothetical protein
MTHGIWLQSVTAQGRSSSQIFEGVLTSTDSALMQIRHPVRSRSESGLNKIEVFGLQVPAFESVGGLMHRSIRQE